MIKTIITQVLVAVMTLGSASTPPQDFEPPLLIAYPTECVAYAPIPKFKTKFQTQVKEFMEFKLLGKCNTDVHCNLKDALKSYLGPKVGITSLRRHWGTKSQHEKGKAVDMEFSRELIDYLVSPEGQNWLVSHNLKFYIETRPGRHTIKPYKANPKYAPYVFENPRATGDHVHIEIQK